MTTMGAVLLAVADDMLDDDTPAMETRCGVAMTDVLPAADLIAASAKRGLALNIDDLTMSTIVVRCLMMGMILGKGMPS